MVRAAERADPLAAFNTTGLAIPRRQILSGGPAKDGIPALVSPTAVRVAAAGFLDPSSRVVGVTINGQTRAYPVNVLNWHEVINDELGGVSIAVIYCPLCDSVSVVDRRIAGRTLQFGVSGLLHNSNVLFYDRTDQALWSQVGLQAISGPLVGRSLQHLAWVVSRFDTWSSNHPEGTVVSFETGHRRNYRVNPYSGYFADDGLVFPVARHDRRLEAKTPVVGVKFGNITRAYPVKLIAQGHDGMMIDTLNGHRLVLQSDRKSSRVAVVEAPPRAQVIHTFWFAWAAFHTGTEIFAPSAATTQGDQH
jgi:hypothetical protein